VPLEESNRHLAPARVVDADEQNLRDVGFHALKVTGRSRQEAGLRLLSGESIREAYWSAPLGRPGSARSRPTSFQPHSWLGVGFQNISTYREGVQGRESGRNIGGPENNQAAAVERPDKREPRGSLL
jgi:hypothetical protein